MTTPPPPRPAGAGGGRPPRLFRYSAAMLLLETAEALNELPIPAWGFGVIALGLLLLMLAIVTHVGGSRPHS